MMKKRRRREGGKGEEGDGGGQGTPVYYRGSVPRIASRKPRKKDREGARWTRAVARKRRKGEARGGRIMRKET